MFFEGTERLLHELPTIGEKENALDALPALEQFHQGDGDPSLARPGGKDHEETPSGGFDPFSDCLDRLDLIGTVNNSLKRHLSSERLPELVEVSKPQQVFLGEETTHLVRWVKVPVPEPDFVTVGQEYERVRAVSGPQGVGVFGRLTFACQRIPAGALGFNNRKRPAETIQQRVVNELVDRTVVNAFRLVHLGRNLDK